MGFTQHHQHGSVHGDWRAMTGASPAAAAGAQAYTTAAAALLASSACSAAPTQVLGLGTDTGDTTPSVLLFFDNLRFLFNVGEGFQRFCVQV